MAEQPLVITADDDSRLAQLQAQYEVAKAEAEGAAERFDAIKTAIKAELHALAGPTSTHVQLVGHGTPLAMRWKETWRVDAKRLKAEDPLTYVKYATKSGTWELRAVPA